jgi:hypothetical protein
MKKTCIIALVGSAILITGVTTVLADDVYMGVNTRQQIETYLTNKFEGISVHAADGVFAVGKEYRQDNKELGVRFGWMDKNDDENLPILDLMFGNYIKNFRIGVQIPVNVDKIERPVALSISYKL